jgi:hypothetical protein
MPSVLVAATVQPLRHVRSARARLVATLAVWCALGAFAMPGDSRASAVRPRHEIVFVADELADRPSLIRDLDRDDPTRVLEVIGLDARRDGVAQVTAALAGRSGIDALHFISHGAPGGFMLGDTFVDADEAIRRAVDLRRWSAALRPGADVLVYGCRAARGDAGARLLRTRPISPARTWPAAIAPSGRRGAGGTGCCAAAPAGSMRAWR